MTTRQDPTSSAAGAPAKTSALQGNGGESLESVLGCFWRWSESFASYSRGSWCGKTSGVLFPLTEDETSEPCLGTFPTSGMMRNGLCYELRTLVCLTAESGCSLWPTKIATSVSQTAPGRTGGVTLEVVAEKNWPSPDANCHKGSAKPGQRVCQIDEAAEQKWSTPNASGQNWSHRHEFLSMPLHRQALTKPNVGPQSLTKIRGSRPRLNPAFVEWLMGFPPLWTETEPKD